jgi:hypothetical protein
MKIIIRLTLLLFASVSYAAEYDKIYSGKYTWGHEVETFKPCNVKETYWVSGSSWVKAPLVDFYTDNTDKPYEPIYIKFRGHLLDEEVDGFASRYNGLIRISEVKEKSLKVPTECK